jgi:putative transposase
MSATKRHRKLVKHFHEPGDLHELTFSCLQSKPLLTNDTWRQHLARCIDAAADEFDFRLAAFVFMPEHLHLLVAPMCQSRQSIAIWPESSSRFRNGSRVIC